MTRRFESEEEGPAEGSAGKGEKRHLGGDARSGTVPTLAPTDQFDREGQGRKCSREANPVGGYQRSRAGADRDDTGQPLRSLTSRGEKRDRHRLTVGLGQEGPRRARAPALPIGPR
jgi:hypothetical protein